MYQGVLRTIDGLRVVVVLVRGQLLRLRFDVELAGEADEVLVLDRGVQETGELAPLSLEIGVDERPVALAAVPEDRVPEAERPKR